MSLKNDICKKIVSVCLGKASLALALGFIILNPVSAYAACTVGNEVELNDYDGPQGAGFNINHPEGGPCVASQYMSPANRFLEGNFVGCTDSTGNPGSAKNPGPHANSTISGTTTGCISRVWRNGSSNANATNCRVFGYRCSGGGSANAQCSTTEPEKCLSGTYQDETDSPTEYKWSCTSSSGGATASVSCGFSKGATSVNGVCSTTANQCTYGTFAEETDTATEFQWRCNGLNGGANSGICKANKVIPAECGYASGGTYTSSPLAADSLCATGNPSGVTGDGTPTAPWSWSCTGINGGANANCSANLCLPPEDGVCNNTTRNSCASGDLSNAGENTTHYTWQCNGRYGGANATNCSRVKNTTTGVCNRSVENGCTSGTLNNTADSGTHFLWQCLGSEGGASDNCDMLKPVSVNGACSTSVNGCSAGDFVDAADDTVNYRWACNGRNGGSNQPCSAAIPPTAGTDVCLSMGGMPSANGQTQCPTQSCFVQFGGMFGGESWYDNDGLWAWFSEVGTLDQTTYMVGAGNYSDLFPNDVSSYNNQSAIRIPSIGVDYQYHPDADALFRENLRDQFRPNIAKHPLLTQRLGGISVAIGKNAKVTLYSGDNYTGTPTTIVGPKIIGGHSGGYTNFGDWTDKAIERQFSMPADNVPDTYMYANNPFRQSPENKSMKVECTTGSAGSYCEPGASKVIVKMSQTPALNFPSASGKTSATIQSNYLNHTDGTQHGIAQAIITHNGETLPISVSCTTNGGNRTTSYGASNGAESGPPACNKFIKATVGGTEFTLKIDYVDGNNNHYSGNDVATATLTPTPNDNCSP